MVKKAVNNATAFWFNGAVKYLVDHFSTGGEWISFGLLLKLLSYLN